MMPPQMIVFPMIATGLFQRIWEDPFTYAVDAVVVIMALGFVIRFAKDFFKDIFSD